MTKPVTGLITFGSSPGPDNTGNLDTNYSLLANTLNDLGTYGNFLQDTSGAANSLVCALPANLTASLAPGLRVEVKVANTNTGATTLAIGLLPATAVLNADGSQLGPAELIAGGLYVFEHNGTAFQLIGGGQTAGYQPGDIRLYGGVPGVDCTAAITAAAAVNGEVIFPFVGATAWVISSTPTIPAGVLLYAAPGATFSGVGSGTLGFSTTYTIGVQYTDFSPKGPNAGVGELASFNFFRNAASTTGAAANVGAAVRVQTNVAAGVVNFEWGILSVLNNSATAGQNVAGYFQSNKQTGAGPTWAAVAECRDTSGNANPTSGQVGLEVDIRASGTDNGLNRVGLDLVLTRYPYNSGANVTFGYGMRVGSFGDAGVTIGAAYTCFNTTVGFGLDVANATVTAGAVRMAQGTAILFDATGTPQKLLSQGLGMDHFGTGGFANRLLNAGGLQVLSHQVVGPQIAGYGTPTGNANQGSFNAATITLPNLAAGVAQLILDLKTHGLIAT